MELRDLIVTPIILFLIYLGAFFVRPYATDVVNRKYFFPALTAKLFGAIALGLIYQFYYNGGDTYNFHTHGSRHIWDAFIDSPEIGINLLFSDGVSEVGIYKYSNQIPFFRDASSFMVIRIAGIFDLLTFSTYSSTALLFALLSFAGSWMLYITFYRRYPQLHFWIAISVLFIPSVIFWGSGLLKDSLMMACLGVLTFEVDKLFIRRQFSILHVGLLLIVLYLIFSVKKYILQAFVPSMMIWIYMTNLRLIRSYVLRILILPVIVLVLVGSAYFSVSKIGENDARYSIENLSHTSKITAYDIRFQTGRDAGSGYTLGELDGSIGSMLRLAPQAINVALFRPYLWEVTNPLMFLSAIESFIFLGIVLYLIFKRGFRLLSGILNPDVSFAIVFSLFYAFAVGVSAFNFGTLARYKIPMMPFFALGILLLFYENRSRKEEELDRKEY